MNKKESEFNKVFSAWDILVIAFGSYDWMGLGCINRKLD